MKKRILILHRDIDNWWRRCCRSMLENGRIWAAGDKWRFCICNQNKRLTGQTSGVSNRYAGVVEPQETVSVELESGRTVKEVQVKTGDQVKKGLAFV